MVDGQVLRLLGLHLRLLSAFDPQVDMYMTLYGRFQEHQGPSRGVLGGWMTPTRTDPCPRKASKG